MEKIPIDIFEEIKTLNFPKGEYIVVGSGIMAVKGLRSAYDLDIVVSKKLFDYCKNNDWELMPWTRTGKIGKEWLKKGIVDLLIEIGLTNETLMLEDLIKEGEMVNGIYFLSLNQLIKFKKEYGRPKDFEDIVLMEEYLKDK